MDAEARKPAVWQCFHAIDVLEGVTGTKRGDRNVIIVYYTIGDTVTHLVKTTTRTQPHKKI